MFFWNSLAFSIIQWMSAIWSLVPLHFLKPAWTSGSSRTSSSSTAEAWLGQFWASLYWRVRWVQLCGSLSILWHCLSLVLEWKLTFFSSVATAEFSKFAGILSAALSQHHLFRIWNSSTEIPSPPLALFIVMFPKSHLTLDSRVSD